MRFQPVKCNVMQIIRRQIKKIMLIKIKYLDITITNDSNGTHISAIFAQRLIRTWARLFKTNDVVS